MSRRLSASVRFKNGFNDKKHGWIVFFLLTVRSCVAVKRRGASGGGGGGGRRSSIAFFPFLALRPAPLALWSYYCGLLTLFLLCGKEEKKKKLLLFTTFRTSLTLFLFLFSLRAFSRCVFFFFYTYAVNGVHGSLVLSRWLDSATKSVQFFFFSFP